MLKEKKYIDTRLVPSKMASIIRIYFIESITCTIKECTRLLRQPCKKWESESIHEMQTSVLSLKENKTQDFSVHAFHNQVSLKRNKEWTDVSWVSLGGKNSWVAISFCGRLPQCPYLIS